MPSERIQRRIDRLLDMAEEAADRKDWPAAAEAAREALSLDTENGDAKALLEAAESMLAGAARFPAPGERAPPAARSETPLTPLPGSFASGRYQVKSFLGEGGRKRVYLALDTRLDREVALAVIKTEGLDTAGLARVRNEARAMARLGDHPNIVTVFDVLEEAATAPFTSSDPRSPGFPASAATAPVIVSQYMAGGSVEDLLAKAEEHRLSTAVVLSIATQVCAALEHAHGLGIVHRDLKPGNVWLTALTPSASSGQAPTLSQRERGQGSLSQRQGDKNPLSQGEREQSHPLSQREREDARPVPPSTGGTPAQSETKESPLSPGERVRVRGSPADVTAKLGDFGLAVALDRSRVTMQGMMLGTVAYMPPEQALGGESTPRADLYSLGCMLYEMVTGRPPFLGEDPTAVISQHINTPPVAPSWLTDRCPPALEEVILYLLAKAPADRPASASEVAAALAKVDPAQKSASHSDSTDNPLDRLARGVFVGRTAELEKLRKAFDEAFAGHGSLVMLVGEPGIGKTRTAQELETYARMRGAQVLWGRTHESGGAPAFWPWVQAGNAYAATNDLALIGPLLPPGAASELSRIFTWLRNQAGFVEPEPITDPESAQFRLFEAYAAFIRAMAGQTPLLIALDDLHWADKPTLLLLQHMARDLSRLRVLVVGNYRDTDLSRTHPLSETLAGLNRDPGFNRIVLRGLSRPEVASYIRAAANVEPKPEVLRRIFEETEGNPFFLSEVVNLMAQEGTLTRESVSDIRIPDGVKEALGRRLSQVSEETNELLQVCAIVGREFTYDTLTLLEDRDEEALLKLIEEGLKARVIEEMEQAGRYRFTHALMQETLLEELSTTRRVRLHGHVGEALEKRWGDRLAAERAPRLAQHFVEAATMSARHAAKAMHYSKLAAEQAEVQTAWTEAKRHYEHCAALLSSSGTSLKEDEAALLLALGRCQRNAAEARPAWRSLMRARTLFKEHGDRVSLARATIEAMQIWAPPHRLRDIIEETLEALGERDPHLRAQLLLGKAQRASLGGVEEERAISQASTLAVQHNYEDINAELAFRQSQTFLYEGRLDEARTLVRQTHEVFHRLGNLTRAGETLRNFGMNLLFVGLLDDGLAVATAAADYSAGQHLGFIYQLAMLDIVGVAFARANYELCDSLLTQIPGDLDFRVDLYPMWKAAMEADLIRATALMPRADRGGGVPTAMTQLHSARAETFLSAGQEAAAREELAAWAEFALLSAAPRLLGLIDVHAAQASGVTQCLARLADDDLVRRTYDALKGLPWIFDAMQGVSYSPVRGILALRLGLTEEASQHFSSGLAWAERERCPVEAGRCLQGLADVAERRGQTREALAHLDRAIALFQKHGARLYLDRALAAKVRLQGITETGIRTSIDTVTESVQAERPALPDWASAPEGTVTILFSDIEDSTVLTERLGDQAWMALLQEHNALIREQVRAHGGFEVKTIGDGFMVAFQSARQALECAIAIQKAMARLEDGSEKREAGTDPNWEGAGSNRSIPPPASRVSHPIRVRIGLHAGEAIRDRDDFYGRNVILASRIGGLALGGQILVSSTVRDLVQGGGFGFDEGREVELKGIAGKQRVFEAAWGA